MNNYSVVLMGFCFVLSACGGGSGGGHIPECGDPPPPREYAIVDYQISSRVHTEPVERATYNYGEPKPDAPVTWDYISIVLESDSTYYEVKAAPTHWSLFPTAAACSFAGPQPSQTITRVSVVSDNAYNDDYPAGSELAGIASVYAYNYIDGVELLSDFASTDAPARESIQFFFTEAPQYANQSFTVTVELDDGSIFVKSTTDLILEGLPTP